VRESLGETLKRSARKQKRHIPFFCKEKRRFGKPTKEALTLFTKGKSEGENI